MKFSASITNFNSGEFSPLLAGRVDLKNYPFGARRMRNFIPTVQGPVRRRSGTRFVAEVKDSNKRSWLGRFVFSSDQAYVIEFDDGVFRFFANHGVVGAPFEVAAPYSYLDYTAPDGTFLIRGVQSGDVKYLTHQFGLYAPYKLTRTGAATFTLTAASFTGGPFQDVNPDETRTVYASANTGAGIALTASVNIFSPNPLAPNEFVGKMFLMEQKKTDAIKMWEPAKVVVLNDVRRSDGKNYHALNGATTGAVKPIHSEGAKFDGDAGVQWQFDDPGYGWVRITAVAPGGLTATADVISRIPDGAVGIGNPTTRWAHEAWYPTAGNPTNVTFFRERLVFARNRNIWGSVSADFENFASRDDGGLITIDMAFRYDTTSDRSDPIRWLVSSNQALMIGTGGDELAIMEAAVAEPFGPGNAVAHKQSEYGSRSVQAFTVGNGVVFVQKSGRKIRDLKQADSVELRWEAEDLTILAEHVTNTGIVDMAYQQETDSIIWCIRTDGSLIGFTLSREQQVRGWHPHRIGGVSDASGAYAVVESITTIPVGNHDELWMIVRRLVNGVSKRYVEYLEAQREDGSDPEDAFFVDSGLSLVNNINSTLTPAVGATVVGSPNILFAAGSPVFSPLDVGRFIHYRWSAVDIKGKRNWHTGIGEIVSWDSANGVRCTIRSAFPNLNTIPVNQWRMTVTTITGLNHLIGETVDVLTDGATHPQRVVDATGQIALEWPSSKIHAGLACPAVVQPMPIEGGSLNGTSASKTKRTAGLAIQFHESQGCKYGRDEDQQMDRILTRSGGNNMDESLPLFTGFANVNFPDGYRDEMLITIIQDQPLPATVVAILPQVNVEDDK